MLCAMADTGAARLLALAVHELRTPATVIGGCLRLLRAIEALPGDRREQLMSQAERNYERLVDLLAEASDLWRLDAGEATFNRQPLPLDRVLRRAAEAVMSGPASPGTRADVRHGRSPLVVADPTRLERAMAALIASVGRQSPEGATVTITTAAVGSSDGRVRIVIGAPEGEADPATLEPIDEFGSGLGLSVPIARRVIEADGGTVGRLPATLPPVIVVELPVHGWS